MSYETVRGPYGPPPSCSCGGLGSPSDCLRVFFVKRQNYIILISSEKLGYIVPYWKKLAPAKSQFGKNWVGQNPNFSKKYTPLIGTNQDTLYQIFISNHLISLIQDGWNLTQKCWVFLKKQKTLSSLICKSYQCRIFLIRHKFSNTHLILKLVNKYSFPPLTAAPHFWVISCILVSMYIRWKAI